jgi:hypothetical protein
MQQNFLSPVGFKFAIKRLPNVSFYVQGASIPGMNATSTTVATPFKSMHFAGDKLEYESFTLTVRVDEYMDSYNEIYDWLVGLTKPETFDQYKDLKKSQYGLYSDASLVILDSRGNPSLEVHFKDIFPSAIGNIVFDTTRSDINYVTCDLTFEHNGFTIHKI